MLILTRSVGERICVGDDIYITVLQVRGNHARLGMDAPPAVEVHREEVYDRIHNNDRTVGSR